MRDLLAVAEKELRDYFTGKRFILLFAVILFLCIAGVALSLNSYNEQLNSYKAAVAGQSTDQYHLQQIKDQQKLIDDAEARGDSPEYVGELKAGLQALTSPPMPSVLPFINGVGIVFVTMGALMAIIMGYGLITREKETGTIKLVLTRPMYRDSLINGKAIAGFVTIAVIFGASFLVILAIMLVYNIVPVGDELLRILALFLVILLYMLLFFSVSLLISTVSPSSTVALLSSVGVFILALVLFGVGAVAGYLLAGPMPETPAAIMNGLPAPVAEVNASTDLSSGYSTGFDGVSYYLSGYNESDPQVIAYRQAMADYNKELKVYYARQQQISDTISIFSPISNFYKLSEVLTSKYAPGHQSYSMFGSYFYTYGTSKELNVFESLAYRWTYLLIFIVEIIATFGLSYMLFMRADVT